ncbi:UNKNOWN [Stylonychia lemnae]|uniref:Uncharacterized protein n=1 Tax=Stylonychia lemnae TaxID=5949 RepID=A0A078A1Z6_STYLE|nr:UNKNOWN [Stylonychia lemnae]|eukprot:CDW74809.1 UNKNOWN [Stylonychia lemnae]
MSDQNQMPKKQVFIQLEGSDNEDDDNNEQQSPDQNRRSFSPDQVVDQHSQNNEEYHQNEVNEDDAEMFERLMQEILERQEVIINYMGSDQNMPIIDSNQNVKTEFKYPSPYIIIIVATYLTNFSYRTFKTYHQKQGNRQVEEQLQIEREKLQQQLRLQANDNKELQMKIKKLNKDVEDLQKSKLAQSINNESTQMEYSNNLIEQLQQKIGDLQKEMRQQSDIIKYQQTNLNDVERELQQQVAANEQLKQQNDANRKSISKQRRPTQEEMQVMHAVQNQELNRQLEEKDLIIQTLQDRIKLLLGNAQVQMNMYTKDMHIRNFTYHQPFSPSPQKKNNFNSNSSKKAKPPKKQQTLHIPQKAVDANLEQKDVILKGVNQAQIIEELLKKKGGINQIGSTDNLRQSDLFIKLDLLNQDYVALIKKFQELQKDNVYLMKLIDDLTKNNDLIDQDFRLLFKQVNDLKTTKPQDSQQKPDRSKKETSFFVSQDIEDIDQLLEYIYILFEEQQYYQASRLWNKVDYKNFLAARFARNIDCLKIVIKLKDEQITELLKQGYMYKDPGEIIGEDKINEIVYKHFKERDDMIGDLQKQNKDLLGKNRELGDQLDKLQTKIELIVGERDFERKKAEKSRKEVDDLAKELKTYKEVVLVELQDKYEKEIGSLMAEIRMLKKQLAKMQNDLALAQENPITEKSADSGEMRIDELEDISNLLKNRRSNNFKDENWDELDDDEIEKRLRMLYAQFFSNDYKHSQDKIRNKNQVFKQLFQICLNDLQTLRDHIKALKKENTDSLNKIKELRKDYESLRKELESSHKYSVKLINRMQSMNNQQEEINKDDLQKLKVLQLLKLIGQLLDDLDEKNNKLQDFKIKRTESDFEADMDKLSRDDALKLLRELSQENEALISRSQSLNDQIIEIIGKIKQSEEQNQILENENDKLIEQYNKIVKKYNEMDKKGQLCPQCLNNNNVKESKPRKTPIEIYEVVHSPPQQQIQQVQEPPKKQLQSKFTATHQPQLSQFSFSRENPSRFQNIAPQNQNRTQTSLTPQQKSAEYFIAKDGYQEFDQPSEFTEAKIHKKIVALRHFNLQNFNRTMGPEERGRIY